MQAAVASLLSFVAGGLVPFVAVIITPEEYKLVATVAAVLVALVLTGYFSANAGKSSRTKAVIRVVIGGSVAMLVTYYVASLFP